MISDIFLNTLYFGNEAYRYLLFFGILILSIILSRIIVWVSENIVKKIIGKTKTKLDDLIIGALDKPAFVAIILAGFYFASFSLQMPEWLYKTYHTIVKIAVIFVLVWALIGLLDVIIVHYLTPLTKKTESDLDDHLIPLLRKLSKISLIVIAIIMILSDLGFNVTSILAGLGLGGLAFALAAQDLLKNLFGGLALITDRPFKLRERIKIGDTEGYVEQIGIRTMQMKTFDDTLISIPNSKVADSTIENVSKRKTIRVKFTLGIACNTPNDKLQKAIKAIEDILNKNKYTDGKATVYFTDFGAYTLDLMIIYYIKDLDRFLPTKHEINLAIKEKLESLGVELPYPTQSVELKK
ncbi:mechanosensitive ion channel family protein [Candidatus Woesearchaeota archaeon]|nr:mechanosensitive ion channel family protein [Candidatus Woesearchaeota archaeon]